MGSMIHRLQKIILAVDHAANIQAGLEIIVNQLIEALQADACTVFLNSEADTQTLTMRANKGLSQESSGSIQLKMGEGMVGRIAEKAESIRVENASGHKSFILFADSGELAYPVFLGVPIISHRKILGVLTVQRSEGAFNEEDEAFLITLAAQLATAIAHARSSGEISDEHGGQSAARSWVKGVPGAPGLAIGEALVLNNGASLQAIQDKSSKDVDADLQLFQLAVNEAKQELSHQADQMRDLLPEEECALFDVYTQMLDGGSLIEDTRENIRQGNWAPGSWRETIENHAFVFEQMSDEYLAERASDIRDLGHRVLRFLVASKEKDIAFPEQTVLVGDEVSVSDLAEVPSAQLCGIVSAHGSSSSHVAILAHALGIPAVMGVTSLSVAQVDGHRVIVDGYSGEAHIDPGRDLLETYQGYIEQENEIQQDLLSLKSLPAVTLDSCRISLYVNSGLMADLSPSLQSGAEGVGLYRTEIPFQVRDRFPSEEEQYQIYRDVLQTFKGMPVVLRTLDVGGDKPLSYFPVKEDNPFLGWRGVRITLDHPEIFLTQVRAMIRASIGLNNLNILLPMIGDMNELDETLIYIHRAKDEIAEEMDIDIRFPRIGAMIEVPSAIYQIEDICELVDFVSVGTNDLTQYLLAVDRNNERVADLYSNLHPAVLKSIRQLIEGARRKNTPVSVCGEMAGDPKGILALLGLGVDSLSMSVGSLLRAKKVIRTFSKAETEIMIEKALEFPGADEVVEFYTEMLDEKNLGGLIRAGK